MPTAPPLTRTHLEERFHAWARPRADWAIGGEFERQAVGDDGQPAAWDGPAGVREVLAALGEATGWQAVTEAGLPIGLRASGSTPCVSLEPGGQVELSGRPHPRLQDLRRELADHLDRLRAVGAARGLRWLACGFHPFARVERIGWVPKSRYAVMREYLSHRGDLAHAMMKATCAVQVNLDYGDEADCARKVRAAAGLSPLATALLASSPLCEGRETGFASWRAHVWSRTDPDRCGFPPVLTAGYSHARWVDHLLATPMMFVRRDGLYRPARGMPFAAFLERGFEGRPATVEDWDLHLTGVFPEVRVKRTIEIRGMDGAPLSLAVAACALWCGLLYAPGALDEALALAEDLARWGRLADLWARAARDGLGAEAGRPFSAWAADLVAIARRGLRAREPEAESMLDPLAALAEAGRSPAAALAEAWRRDPRPEAYLPLVVG